MNNYAFIDSQNLHMGVSTNQYDKKTNKLIYRGWNLDYRKFRQYLKDKYSITKAFMFIGKMPGNEALYESLQSNGFILIFKPTIIRGDETKGNVDAELVLHAMIEFENYDKTIIISNDGDFFCLIEYLANKEKLLKILTPNEKYSSLLKEYSSYISKISDLKPQLEYKKKKAKISGRSKP